MIIYNFRDNSSILAYAQNILNNPAYMTYNCSEGEMEQSIVTTVPVSDWTFSSDQNTTMFIFKHFRENPPRLCFLDAQGETIWLAKSLWFIFWFQMAGTGIVCLANFGDYAFNLLFFITVVLYYLVYRNDYNEHIISGLFRQDKWPVLFFFIVCFAWKNWHFIFPRKKIPVVAGASAAVTSAAVSPILLPPTPPAPKRKKGAKSSSTPAAFVSVPSTKKLPLINKIYNSIKAVFMALRSEPYDIDEDARASRYPRKLLWLTPACVGLIFAFNTSDGSNLAQNLTHLIAVALYGVIWFLNSKKFTNHARHPPFAASMIYGILTFQVINYFVGKNKAYYAFSLSKLPDDFVHAPPAFIHMARMCFFSELVLFAASL